MAGRAVTAEPRWLNASEQRVWRAYLDVTRMVNERLGRQLAEDSQLSLAEYEILVQLSESPDRRLRMSELAERAVNSRSRLTHTVSRMEARGMVRREPCPEDRRGVWCLLTDDGFAVIEKAAPGHVEAVRAAVFDLLDGAETEAFGVALITLHEQLRGS
ncbi:MAG: MarR family transcriptional regulator [Kineosporiaceae bacterium]|nr:MarR family transcriptional regulator [Kineosporiaceae bacterium]MBK8075757.1 MarR family transcriptional regulator [Kineosporiaceae bacterium]